MIEFLLRAGFFIVAGLIWAAVQIATTSKNSIDHKGYRELKLGFACHFNTAFLWLGGLGFYALFYFGLGTDFTIKGHLFFAVIILFLIWITADAYLKKLYFDEFYLRIETPFGAKIYDWDDLKKIYDWDHLSGSTLVLKFNKFQWVVIPAIYHGYDELERLAYRKSYQYPRP